mmetsp:Transcript_30694/g.67407  ORF Transcript_30694/g.67407 Transcript_30694/m.67407 type:complete len:246 (-) Transcript_30694:73-810(-)
MDAKERILFLHHNREIEDLFDSYADTFDSHLLEGLRYNVPNLMREQFAAFEEGSCASATCRTTTTTTGSNNERRRPFARCLDLGCGTGLAGVAFRDVCDYLEGNDLSSEMVAKAQAREGVYDAVGHGDAVNCLRRQPDASVDLLLSADVVMYVFSLPRLLEQAKRALRRDGLFIFSTESLDDAEGIAGGVVERESRRFAHSRDYVMSAADGFDLGSVDNFAVRNDDGKAIRGDIFVLRRRDDSEA